MSEVSLSQWRDFVEHQPETHLLQTGEWGELKSSFGWQVSRLIANGVGAQVLFRKLPLGFAFGYLPKGPIGSGEKAHRFRQFWDEIDSVCQRNRAIFLKVEPDEWDDHVGGSPSPALFEAGPKAKWQASPHSIQPRRTLVVDLRGSEKQILERMKPKCRYNIGLARRKGVAVRPWRDVSAFQVMMQATGRRDGFAVHSSGYMQRAFDLFNASGVAELFTAVHGDRHLAGLMAFRRGRRAWYLYGASVDESRELMPNYLLQWEAMLWARRCGCEEYDLWGVPDEAEAQLEAGFERRHDGLWGVYRFKRGFGGQLRRAAQAQDRVFSPFLYSIYRRRVSVQGIA